jgi:hypothetical protein
MNKFIWRKLFIFLRSENYILFQNFWAQESQILDRSMFGKIWTISNCLKFWNCLNHFECATHYCDPGPTGQRPCVPCSVPCHARAAHPRPSATGRCRPPRQAPPPSFSVLHMDTCPRPPSFHCTIKRCHLPLPPLFFFPLTRYCDPEPTSQRPRVPWLSKQPT